MDKVNSFFEEFIEQCINKDETLLTIDKVFDNRKLDSTGRFLNCIYSMNKRAKGENKKNKNKEAKTIGVSQIFDGSAFEDAAIKKDYENDKSAIIQILLHCNWLMYLCSEQQHKQQAASDYYIDDIDKYFKEDIKWSIGATLSSIPLDAMMYIVQLIKNAKDEKNKWESAAKIIKNLDFDCKWDDDSNVSSDAIKNIILFLCDNENYLPIPAQNMKDAIVGGLKDLRNEELANDYWKNNEQDEINYNLYLIRKSIRQAYSGDDEIKNTLNPFWHSSINPFWDTTNSNLSNESLSDETLLEYKKAMILYGPPGTSKSYLARKMAENIIAKALLDDRSLDIKKRIEKMAEARKNNIHKLQLHPNYTYDDFIVGKTISDQGKGIKVEKGFMLKLIDGIGKKDTLPHIIILDEINRVDISRVFGELFTAMEPSYRKDGEGVKLSVKDEKGNDMFLKVPENMYFIGTMNMIDFSLEQVDFALRRRFLWRLSTYEKKRLENIIGEKMQKIKMVSPDVESIPEDYSKCCTGLNNLIANESILGKDYLIGHAFFAEIVDIFNKTYDWNIAKNLLWQISILPTLEAYCGTMETQTKNDFIQKCRAIFLPQKTKDKEDNKKIGNSVGEQDDSDVIDE